MKEVEKDIIKQYENGLSSYELSKKLINENFFKKIISDSKKLNNGMKSYSAPDLNEKNINKEWKNYLKITNEFCRLYRFYEQPFQQKLEESILKYISEGELIKKIADLNLLKNTN